MNLLIAYQTELIKTKRSAALWIAVLGAGLIPLVNFLYFLLKPAHAAERLGPAAWQSYFGDAWQSFASFLLPMFIILICSLIPQIEYKNNTWKQVYAAPLSLSTVFFSKLMAILTMVLVLVVMFNVFMVLSAYIVNFIHPNFLFLKQPFPALKVAGLSVHSLISLLGIIGIQYWFSLRFRNFIVPISIGLGLLVTNLIAMSWEHADKLPYNFPLFTFMKSMSNAASATGLQKHEWYSIAYFALFVIIALLDIRNRKERG